MTPKHNELLIIGKNPSCNSALATFSSHVGQGSSTLVVRLTSPTILSTLSGETSENLSHKTGQDAESYTASFCDDNPESKSALIQSILPAVKLANCSQQTTETSSSPSKLQERTRQQTVGKSSTGHDFVAMLAARSFLFPAIIASV